MYCYPFHISSLNNSIKKNILISTKQFEKLQMKFFSSLLIVVIFGILIENMMTKYLLVDLEKESKDARGPGMMIIWNFELITLDLVKTLKFEA